ncbi:MAG TPA: alpha/beta hydrolase [Hyphomicrobiaceae bacterium]|nr:alpha/beta hydrolase [Hyphomicrobiaceae bacterium]
MMSALDYEAEYNNRRRVPEHPEINARWAKASAAYRAEAALEADQSYGSGARHRYDLYRPRGGAKDAPLVVYIHGGYWQRGDRKDYAFIARALNAAGLAVALPTYSLCPAVTIMDIVAELRRCLATLWERTRQRPVVVGHSAGGHLAAAMLATDWSKVGGAPNDLVRAGYSLSGVFDPAPLIGTSLNEALKLDASSAREASLLYWPPPPKGRPFVAAVGADESQEFIRQSLEITAAWSRAGVKAECVLVPSANHFTIVDELARPDSAMLARVVALARA